MNFADPGLARFDTPDALLAGARYQVVPVAVEPESPYATSEKRDGRALCENVEDVQERPLSLPPDKPTTTVAISIRLVVIALVTF